MNPLDHSATSTGQANRGSPPLLLLVNPTSRSGRAKRRVPHATALLDRYGLRFELRNTLPNRGTIDLVSRAITDEGFRTIIYIGGDGTFNEVAKGICQSGKAQDVRLGMLPSGTANDQAKSFGISPKLKALEKNIKTIVLGYTTTLDVGEVEARSESGVVIRRDLFFDSTGWGLSAAILAFRNRELEIVKKLPVVRDMYRDHTVYVRAAARELALNWLTRDRFVVHAVIDGQSYTFERLSDLVVNNTIIYAGEWITDMTAKHDDGEFELVPFSSAADWASKLILNHKKFPLAEQRIQRTSAAPTKTYRGKKIALEFIKPNKNKKLLAQLDGEEFPQAEYFDITVHQGLIRLIVPEGFHWI